MTEPLLIRADRVFDGATMRTGVAVLVRDGVIVEVGRDVTAVDATVVDAPGQTLLPGLIDAHTHAFPGRLEQALAFGVTTELDMFADPAAVAELRHETTDRAALRSAGTGATAPGGHPCQLVDQGLVPPFPTIAGPGAAERFVADRVAEGSDYLKVFLEPGTSTGRAQPTPDDATVRALVAAGHAAGLLVVAHATDADAARRAVAAGVDGLVHVWVDGAAPDLVAAVAAADVFVVPTLTVIDGLWGTGAGARTLASEKRVAPYLDDVSRGGLGMGGVGLASRTARRSRPRQSARCTRPGWRSSRARTRPTRAPRTAHGPACTRSCGCWSQPGSHRSRRCGPRTAEPAARFRLADRGRVAPGLVADLVLVAGDPTRDVTATTAITAVWRRGVRLERESYAAGLAPARSLVDLGGLDPVAATARWVAAERARESARPDALFTDPLADRLAGEPGRALAAWMRGDSQFESPTLPVRTRFFDDAVLAAVGRARARPTAVAQLGHPTPTGSQPPRPPAAGRRPTRPPAARHHPPTDPPPPTSRPPKTRPPTTRPPATYPPTTHPSTRPRPTSRPRDRPPADQVVVLAAGMDARAYRLDLPAELAWFELDRPALLAVKERELAEVVPRCRRYAIGCDLAEDWPAALLGAGFDPARPAVWLVEGLLAYLDGDLVELLLDRLTALAAPGSHLLCDPIGKSLLASPWMRPYLAKLADAGMAWRFGTERPEELLVPRGWRPTVSLMADVATGLGRWPFPQMPATPPACRRAPRPRAAVAAPPSPKRRLAVPITETRRPENGDSPSSGGRVRRLRRGGVPPGGGRAGGRAGTATSAWLRAGPSACCTSRPGRPPDQAWPSPSTSHSCSTTRPRRAYHRVVRTPDSPTVIDERSGPAPLKASHCAATRVPLAGATTRSAMPCTITAGGSGGAPGAGSGTTPRAAFAPNDPAGPVAERYGGAECTPTPANRSG